MLVHGKDLKPGLSKQGTQSKRDSAVDRGLKISKYELYALIILVLAVLLRIVLTISGWPQTNSDEDTMGLMAMHIASHGEHPIFFYGQTYMGALEAYLGAAIFQLFGASVFTLRLVTILLFALFLVSMYLLTSLLYSKKLALVTLVLLSLGSNVVLDIELITLGGYPELLLFGSLALLLSVWLALSSDQPLSRRRQFLRIIAYACWGLIVGIGFWSDFLMFIFALVSGLLLLIFCWRELLKGAVLPLLIGLLIGVSPLIVYNLNPVPGEGTLRVLSLLHNYGSVELSQNQAYSKDPLLHEISETLLITLPSATGGPSLCNDSDLRLFGYASIGPFQCSTLLQTKQSEIFLALSWSLGFILLWAIAVFFAVQGLFRLLRWSQGPWSPQQRRSAVHYSARLMLLGSAGLSVLLFAETPGAAVWPNNARYLIDLLIATPALIAPLWGLSDDYTTQPLDITTSKEQQARKPFPILANPSTIKAVLGRGMLLLIGIVLLVGTITTFSEIPTVQASSQQQEALIHDLLQMKATHIYSDYWTCDRIIFLTKEQIICGVIPPGRNRYPLYYVTVKRDPNSAYVLPKNFSQAAEIAEQIVHSKKRYRRFVFDGYVVYQPSS